MKQITKALLLSLTIALSFVACDKDDDIDEIFKGNTWNLTFIQNGADRFIPQESGYTLSFTETEFNFTTPAGVIISGIWYADGGQHNIKFSDITANKAVDIDSTPKTIMNILEKATMYSGDANWLQIIEEQGFTYMQFYNR